MTSRSELVDALNDALVAVQRIPRRAGYRQRLFGSVDVPGGLGGFRVLRAVELAHGDTPSIGDVAEVLVVDPSTASRLVERCVGAGLLRREAHDDDRRKARLQLTPQGVGLLGKVSRNRRALFTDIASEWAEEDLEQFVGLLRTLLAGLDRFEGDS